MATTALQDATEYSRELQREAEENPGNSAWFLKCAERFWRLAQRILFLEMQNADLSAEVKRLKDLLTLKEEQDSSMRIVRQEQQNKELRYLCMKPKPTADGVRPLFPADPILDQMREHMKMK